ncbi:MAG: hypothetical protein JRM80_11905 [Nitrososphaerota archaeon]|nr:hypothetical protein [Nitrososphaerota archaeon]
MIQGARGRKKGPLWVLPFALVGGLATATMVNAPALFIGYGLPYPVMLFAAWAFRPARAAAAELGAVLVALPFFLVPQSTFVAIALYFTAARPLVTYAASKVYWSRGRLASVVVLTALDTLASLAIGILQFGVTGIEAGAAVFGATLAVFSYAAFHFGRLGVAGVVGGFASLLAMLEYYLGLLAYFAPYTVLLAVLALALLLVGGRRGPHPSKLVYVALVLVLVAPAVGGPALSANASVASYPFRPSGWSGTQWAQTSPACPATPDVFASVYNPARLRIVDPCVTVTGTVDPPVVEEYDGDFTFFLRPVSPNATTLAISSFFLWKGDIHPEVVPADQGRILAPLGGGVCPGDVLRVTGALVLDTDHGSFTEIHPVYSIAVLSAVGTWPQCLQG